MASATDVSSWDFDPGYDLRLKGNHENHVVTVVNVVLNSASILCGSLVLLIYFSIRAFEPKLMDRVSLRLTAAISAVDVLKAIVYILFTYVAVSGPACDFSAWAIIFLTNYYIFLTCMIAFNLQYVFLHSRPYHLRLERIYFIASTALAFATTIPAWAADRVGWDDNVGVCWWKQYSSKRTKVWEWGSFLFWIVAGSIYCLVIVILVIAKLERKLRQFSKINKRFSLEELSSMEERRRKTQKTINRLVARITLYTLIPILTQGGFILMELWLQFKHDMNPHINYWSVVGTDIPGVLNLVAFLLDPALHNSCLVVRERLISMYCEEEIDSTPLRNRPSSNTSPIPEDNLPSYTRFMKWLVNNVLDSKRYHTAGVSFYCMPPKQHVTSDENCYGPTQIQPPTSIELNALTSKPQYSNDNHMREIDHLEAQAVLCDHCKVTSKEEKVELGKFIRGL